MQAPALLDTFNPAGIFLYPFPDLCVGTILSFRFNAVVVVVISVVTFIWGTLWKIHEFNLGQVDSNPSCRSVSRTIDWTMTHQNSFASVITKGMNTYVNGTFQSFFNKVTTLCKNIASLWDALCVVWWGGKRIWIQFKMIKMWKGLKTFCQHCISASELSMSTFWLHSGRRADTKNEYDKLEKIFKLQIIYDPLLMLY